MYSLEQGKTFQVTDGMSDALYPAFDKNGKYLYFTASTNVALTTAGLDMSSDEHRVTRSVYVAVLSKDEKSPLAPESDEEKSRKTKRSPIRIKTRTKQPTRPKTKTKDKTGSGQIGRRQGQRDKTTKTKTKTRKKPVVVKIDIDGIGQRILSLPIPAKNYLNLLPGKSGILFLCRRPHGRHRRRLSQPVSQTIQKFDLSNARSTSSWRM